MTGLHSLDWIVIGFYFGKPSQNLLCGLAMWQE